MDYNNTRLIDKTKYNAFKAGNLQMWLSSTDQTIKSKSGNKLINVNASPAGLIEFIIH